MTLGVAFKHNEHSMREVTVMNLRTIFQAALFIATSLLLCLPIAAQTRIGTIQGTVKDPNGAVVAGAKVTITQPVTGYHQSAQTDAEGTFKLMNVPFNTYTLGVEGDGFQPSEKAVDLESALPLSVDVSLAVTGVADEVNVTADSNLIETDKTSSDTDINQSLIERQAGAAPSRGMEAIVASAPGFATDDNGRMHPRGSESQVQYVIDGVPQFAVGEEVVVFLYRTPLGYVRVYGLSQGKFSVRHDIARFKVLVRRAMAGKR